MADRIFETKDYKRFDSHDVNRDVIKKTDSFKRLKRSMQIHGWLGDSPMAVSLKKDGKFKIERGHHRFCAAEDLGIAVKYVIDNSGIEFSEIERTVTTWHLNHYLQTYVRRGHSDYIQLKEYCDNTGIALSPAIAMLSGQFNSVGSTILERFKIGTFKIKDTNHAVTVGEIILLLKKCGIAWAASSPLVQAFSKILSIKEADTKILKKKLEVHLALISKKPGVEAYQLMIEEIYNRGNQKRIPLSFLANEEARKRRSKYFTNGESRSK